MKKIWIASLILTAIWACSDQSGNTSSNDAQKPTKKETKKEVKKEMPPADDGKGVGEIKEVKLNDPLNSEMIVEGKAIYELKCAPCHKLTDKRLAGPGWEGVTERRKPEWIMNMITNVDMMLAEDAEAQKLLEECLTRMPNQNVSVEDARSILEFMYHNDAS